MTFRLPIGLLAISLGLILPCAAQADWDAKHLRLVRTAPTSLRQAVRTVEHDLKGRAYSAVTNVEDVVVSYSIKIDTGDKTLVGVVDAKTGKLSDGVSAVSENNAQLKELAKYKGTLMAAIKAAESTAKGKSFLAVYKRIGNKDVFEIDVAGRDDVEKDVLVDAATGKIRKVAEKSADSGTGPGPTPAATGIAQ